MDSIYQPAMGLPTEHQPAQGPLPDGVVTKNICWAGGTCKL